MKKRCVDKKWGRLLRINEKFNDPTGRFVGIVIGEFEWANLYDEHVLVYDTKDHGVWEWCIVEAKYLIPNELKDIKEPTEADDGYAYYSVDGKFIMLSRFPVFNWRSHRTLIKWVDKHRAELPELVEELLKNKNN